MRFNFSVVCLIIAILLFAVFALVSLGTITTGHANAWLGFGLVAFAAAHLPVTS